MGVAEIYRYERKFVVSENAAEAIRSFVLAYLPIDEHVTPDQPRGYQVTSLYLDTPTLDLYHQSCHGIKNRYKLRVRFYDTREDSPAFLEIKQRTTETVHKLRAAVTKRAAEEVLRGRWISSADLLSNGDASLRALAAFCERRDQLRAAGMAFVSYIREAFVSRTAEAVRVTIDRKIAGHPYYPDAGLVTPEETAVVAVNGVVLELKYNGRAPRWMHDLVTSFGLQRLSFPKYVYAVNALGIAPQMAGFAARRSVRC
jgi:SPX domain protein involved in polyphosphate accumulation